MTLAELCPLLPAELAEKIEARQRYRNVWPVETAGQRSLWHATCSHRMYNLGCDEFEALLASAHYACQRCSGTNERLYIDHDHEIGMWGVRGILCPACNSLLGRVDAGRSPADDLTARYLANPYPHRHPFEVGGQHTLYTLVFWTYQAEESIAARKAGWPIDKVARMGVLRRTKKWKAWREQWQCESGTHLLIELLASLEARS